MLLQKPDRVRGFKKERIIRVLLNQSGSWLRTEEGTNNSGKEREGSNSGKNQERKQLSKYRVAKLAEVSEPWCLEFTKRLENKGLVEDTRVIKPRQLYQKWKEIRIEPNRTSFSLQQPLNFLTKAQKEQGLDYALTTYQADKLVQGFLFPSLTDFYIPPDQIEQWETLLKEKGLAGGGNTRIRITDSHVFYHKFSKEEKTIVSIPQVIVDLLEEGGPCEEAADKLMESYHPEIESSQESRK